MRFSQSSWLEYQLSPFPIHFPASSFWQHTNLNLLMHSVPLEWQRPHNRRKTHLWRHSHMQLFIESENYRTASGNSKLTSLPVSFLYTEAKVSVLCSMLVCWVLSRCTLNRREPSRRILEKSDFNFIQNNLSRICVSVSVRDEPDPLANNLGGVDEVVEDGGVHSLQGSRPGQIQDSVGFSWPAM